MNVRRRSGDRRGRLARTVSLERYEIAFREHDVSAAVLPNDFSLNLSDGRAI
jgi:hypothetical protein